MFETIKVPNSMKDLADKFKEALAKSDFTDIGRMISDKLSNALESIQWNKVYRHAENFGKDIATFLNGLITPRMILEKPLQIQLTLRSMRQTLLLLILTGAI